MTEELYRNYTIFAVVSAICILVGIVLLNWGKRLKIKRPSLWGALLILSGTGFLAGIYFPRALEYFDARKLDLELKGIVSEKYLHPDNPLSGVIKIIGEDGKPVSLSLDAGSFYQRLQIGDSVLKSPGSRTIYRRFPSGTDSTVIAD